MDNREFVANMVAKYVFNQWKYEKIITEDEVILHGRDSFSGSTLADVARLCEVLSLVWYIIVMNGIIELHILVPEELYERGERDE